MSLPTACCDAEDSRSERQQGLCLRRLCSMNCLNTTQIYDIDSNTLKTFLRAYARSASSAAYYDADVKFTLSVALNNANVNPTSQTWGNTTRLQKLGTQQGQTCLVPHWQAVGAALPANSSTSKAGKQPLLYEPALPLRHCRRQDGRRWRTCLKLYLGWPRSLSVRRPICRGYPFLTPLLSIMFPPIAGQQDLRRSFCIGLRVEQRLGIA